MRLSSLPSKASFDEADLRSLNLFPRLERLLTHLHGVRPHPCRRLHMDQYLALLLLYFFNPVITSMRGLVHASSFARVRKQLGLTRTSLGAMSEAANLFPAGYVRSLLQHLAKQAQHRGVCTGRYRGLPRWFSVIAADSTLWRALPNMAWALWIDDTHRGVRGHLQFDLGQGLPVDIQVTPAQADERTVLARSLQPNRLYVMDRGYRRYAFFQNILDCGSSFLIRLKEKSRYQIVGDSEPSPASDSAGVVFDRRVRLGGPKARGGLKQPLRLIMAERLRPASPARCPKHKRGKHKAPAAGQPTLQRLLLATDRFDLPAETLVLMYRDRWQIELFFRWLKCILGCRHLLAHSQNGIALQVYTAIVASLLIVLWTGQKPTKRTLETLQFYLMGWATLEEVDAHLRLSEKSI